MQKRGGSKRWVLHLRRRHGFPGCQPPAIPPCPLARPWQSWAPPGTPQSRHRRSRRTSEPPSSRAGDHPRVLPLPPAIPSAIHQGWSGRAGKVTANREGAPCKRTLQCTGKGKGEKCWAHWDSDQALGQDTRHSLRHKSVLRQPGLTLFYAHHFGPVGARMSPASHIRAGTGGLYPGLGCPPGAAAGFPF